MYTPIPTTENTQATHTNGPDTTDHQIVDVCVVENLEAARGTHTPPRGRWVDSVNPLANPPTFLNSVNKTQNLDMGT
jgi:hypothetical protein